MGVLGCPDFHLKSFEFEKNEFFLTNVCSDCLYHGIDWVYTFVDTIYSYDFKVWYFWFMNSIFDNSFDYFFSRIESAWLPTKFVILVFLHFESK